MYPIELKVQQNLTNMINNYRKTKRRQLNNHYERSFLNKISFQDMICNLQLDSPIVDSLSIPSHLHSVLNMKVADFILDGNWNIPRYLIQKKESLARQILTVTLPTEDTSEKLNWRGSSDGELTCQIAYSALRVSRPALR